MKSCSLIAIAVVLFAVTVVGQAAPKDQVTATSVRASFGKLPLYFVENRGVYPDEVRYYIQGAEKTLFFTDQGVTIRLKGKERGWTVKLDFVGANPDARPEGLIKQEAVLSYFRGKKEDWKAGLESFAKVVYRDLWPGIDLVYNGAVNTLKYQFIVAPGADPTNIRLRYRGVDKLARTETGAIRVTTPELSFEDAQPVAWQDIDGRRVPVEMAYGLEFEVAGGSTTFGFRVGSYDSAYPLVLDPAMLVYCGYIGGYCGDGGSGAAVDAAGNLYVTGTTDSDENSFPVKVGPDLPYNGGTDVFVAKVNAAGTGLVYCGYIGGSASDGGSEIAVDVAGNAYVVGGTESSEQTFPVVVGPDLTHNSVGRPYPDGGDAFVAKVALTLLEASGTPRPGSTINLTLTSTDDVGLAYVFGSSFGTGPIKIGNRSIGLSVDKLLEVSLGNVWPNVFVGYQGIIGSNGQAAAKIIVPSFAGLVGQKIHTAFVTIGPTSPFGIKSISNTFLFTITK